MTEQDRDGFSDESLLNLFADDLYQTTNGTFGLYVWDPSSGNPYLVRADNGQRYEELTPREARRIYRPPNPFVEVEYVAPDDGQPYETPDGWM